MTKFPPTPPAIDGFQWTYSHDIIGQLRVCYLHAPSLRDHFVARVVRLMESGEGYATFDEHVIGECCSSGYYRSMDEALAATALWATRHRSKLLAGMHSGRRGECPQQIARY